MKIIIVFLKLLFGAITGVVIQFMGNLDGFIYVLLLFMATDYLTGIMKAILDKKISSDVGFRGIFKKILILVMIAISSVVDRELLNNGDILKDGVVFFYIANEGVSILENICDIGLPIPDEIRGVLSQIKKSPKNESEDDNNGDK